jgi:hypothetical protein
VPAHFHPPWWASRSGAEVFTTFENKKKLPVCMHLQVIDGRSEERYLEPA